MWKNEEKNRDVNSYSMLSTCQSVPEVFYEVHSVVMWKGQLLTWPGNLPSIVDRGVNFLQDTKSLLLCKAAACNFQLWKQMKQCLTMYLKDHTAPINIPLQCMSAKRPCKSTALSEVLSFGCYLATQQRVAGIGHLAPSSQEFYRHGHQKWNNDILTCSISTVYKISI